MWLSSFLLRSDFQLSPTFLAFLRFFTSLSPSAAIFLLVCLFLFFLLSVASQSPLFFAPCIAKVHSLLVNLSLSSPTSTVTLSEFSSRFFSLSSLRFSFTSTIASTFRRSQQQRINFQNALSTVTKAMPCRILPSYADNSPAVLTLEIYPMSLVALIHTRVRVFTSFRNCPLASVSEVYFYTFSLCNIDLPI